MRHPHGLRAAAGAGGGLQDPEIGSAYEGGFYAGKIRYQGIIWYLIVAPSATGASGTGYTLTTNYAWKTAQTTTAGTLSDINGHSNTAAMVTAGIANHPAGQFCTTLNINGFTDWYLPARYELDAAYKTLKPTTTANNTSFGINPYLIPPQTTNHTTGDPAQTTVTDFKDTGSEPFVADIHWSSTEFSSGNAWDLAFNNGFQFAANKTATNRRVRAFRRVISPIQTDELNPLGLLPGDALEGGLFAGYISHTANGVPTHALIVAPRATGASGTGYTINTNRQWKTSNTFTAGTTSSFDGAANTAAMVTAGIANHPAANFCVNLSIGGFTDWYLPARLELDIAYQNLKPVTSNNDTSWGINAYSVPKRTANRTAGDPTQTSVLAFRSTGAEAFEDTFHWSSTEASDSTAWVLRFDSGPQFNSGSKNFADRVRAFRKVAL
jgi:hypothetical protein